MPKGHEAYVLRMSTTSMRIYPVCMMLITIHLLINGIVMRLEFRLVTMEVHTCWQKQGREMFTKLFPMNESG
jgi:hypothetical protein